MNWRCDNSCLSVARQY